MRALVLASALLLTVACSGGREPSGHPRSGEAMGPASPTPSPPAGLPSTDPSLAPYYDQVLAWKGCGGGDVCASMRVPLDYSAPAGRTIEVKIAKVPATERKTGTLVVNPGGPGLSGIGYAEAKASAWSLELLRHYDVVGFDPRGVGRSTPLHCLGTTRTDELVAADPDPDTASERQHADALMKGLGSACLVHDGDLVRHMSTVEVARDMDVLRQLLGEPRLTYFGLSYGTRLGATYAQLFPGHVRRMVLDAAVDPARSLSQLWLGRARGMELALRSYIRTSCLTQGPCFLGKTVATAERRVRRLLAGVDRTPLPTNEGRRLRIGNAMTGLQHMLVIPPYWPTLNSALQQAMRGDGSLLMSMSDEATSRGANGYVDNRVQAEPAVECLDYRDAIRSDEVPASFARFEKASPTFGRAYAFLQAECSTWPARTNKAPAPIHARGAPPIVVIGTSRDPLTPYPFATSLAKELDSGVLVSRDGDGHGGYFRGNFCVDHAVDRYLLQGHVPRQGLRC